MVLSRSQAGFTVIELIVVIIVAIFVAGLFWVQKSDARLRGEDSLRKQEINAIHYYLEGAYYPTHRGYPEKLEATHLKGLDPESLKDPANQEVNNKESDYTYEPSGCQNNLCQGYKLTAKLAKEAPFVKSSR